MYCTVLHPNSTEDDFSKIGLTPTFLLFFVRLDFSTEFVKSDLAPSGAVCFNYSRESEDLSVRTSEYRIFSVVWYWPPAGSDSLPCANPHAFTVDSLGNSPQQSRRDRAKIAKIDNCVFTYGEIQDVW